MNATRRMCWGAIKSDAHESSCVLKYAWSARLALLARAIARQASHSRITFNRTRCAELAKRISRD